MEIAIKIEVDGELVYVCTAPTVDIAIEKLGAWERANSKLDCQESV